jgi:hypothetical protein
VKNRVIIQCFRAPSQPPPQGGGVIQKAEESWLEPLQKKLDKTGGNADARWNLLLAGSSIQRARWSGPSAGMFGWKGFKKLLIA